MRSTFFASVALCCAASACGGGGGSLSGKVTVAGGSAAGLAVHVEGPTLTAAVTDDQGNFVAKGLLDGAYVVSAELSAAAVPVQRATVTVAGGKADKDVTLAFQIPDGQVSGRVTFADGSAASGLTVVLSGASTRGVQTGADGSFTLDAVPPGAWVVAVEAIDTREHRLAVSFTVETGQAPVALPDLVFTPVGYFSGVVKGPSGMGAGAVRVEVAGTDKVLFTDAAGNFTFTDVPTGMRQVVAHQANSGVGLIAKADVTVARGKNADLTLTLANDMPPTGTAAGAVSFWSSQLANLITVSVVGTDLKTTVSPQGAFSLAVPVGEWELAADAPNYPRLSLGRVTVKQGLTTAVAPAHLTLYRRFAPDTAGLSSASIETVSEDGRWLVVRTSSSSSSFISWWLIDGKSLSRRLVHYSNQGNAGGSFVLSPAGKFLSYNPNPFGGNGILVIDLTTGESKTVPRTALFGVQEFSSDETTFFVSDAFNATFARLNLVTGVLTQWPMAQGTRLTRDRWYVRAQTNGDVNLVTTTADTPLFTQVTSSGPNPTPWAFTNCTGAMPPLLCTLRILPPGASAPITAPGMFSTANPVLQSAALPSNGDWLILGPGGTGDRLVKTTDGTQVLLPANTTRVSFNENLSRVFYLSSTGTQQALREEAVPPTGSATPIATSASLASFSPAEYVSPTRLMAFEPTRRLDIKSGVLTADSDLVAGSGSITGPFTHWGQTSTMKRMGVVADSVNYPLDLPSNEPFVSVGGTEGQGKAGRYGAVSSSAAATGKGIFLIEAASGLRRLSALQVVFTGVSTLPTWFRTTHPSSQEQGVSLWATDQFITITEPRLSNPSQAVRASGGYWLVSVDTVDGRLAVGELP